MSERIEIQNPLEMLVINTDHEQANQMNAAFAVEAARVQTETQQGEIAARRQARLDAEGQRQVHQARKDVERAWSKPTLNPTETDPVTGKILKREAADAAEIEEVVRNSQVKLHAMEHFMPSVVDGNDGRRVNAEEQAPRTGIHTKNTTMTNVIAEGSSSSRAFDESAKKIEDEQHNMSIDDLEAAITSANLSGLDLLSEDLEAILEEKYAEQYAKEEAARVAAIAAQKLNRSKVSEDTLGGDKALSILDQLNGKKPSAQTESDAAKKSDELAEPTDATTETPEPAAKKPKPTPGPAAERARAEKYAERAAAEQSSAEELPVVTEEDLSSDDSEAAAEEEAAAQITLPEAPTPPTPAEGVLGGMLKTREEEAAEKQAKDEAKEEAKKAKAAHPIKTRINETAVRNGKRWDRAKRFVKGGTLRDAFNNIADIDDLADHNAKFDVDVDASRFRHLLPIDAAEKPGVKKGATAGLGEFLINSYETDGRNPYPVGKVKADPNTVQPIPELKTLPQFTYDYNDEKSAADTARSAATKVRSAAGKVAKVAAKNPISQRRQARQEAATAAKSAENNDGDDDEAQTPGRVTRVRSAVTARRAAARQRRQNLRGSGGSHRTQP
jgi:hypothetical protein